jgi:hypothetical protein
MRLTDAQLQEAIDLVAKYGTITQAAAGGDINPNTLQHRYREATRRGLKPSIEAPDLAARLRIAVDRIAVLEKQLVGAGKDTVNAEYIKQKVIQLKDSPVTLPAWLVDPKPSKHSPGVPTLLASDWHWGEVIDPEQMGGRNKYNMAVARDRARLFIDRAVDLLTNHMVNPTYPGIVFALGGDMVSGDIHEELTETNELPIMPTVVDLFGVLIWCIETLVQRFGHVFVPCVTGNHGRNTKKKRAKGRHHTSFDWLLYVLLKKHFENDKRVNVMVPDGPYAYYKVFGHRYLLTHGDEFYGGDGIIGALGPIIRGDQRWRSRNLEIDMAYDTMLIGHWHQYMPLERVIVNGSLCGYNEYANLRAFPFERPRQALWITHPVLGMTFRIPVYVERYGKAQAAEWVSIST